MTKSFLFSIALLLSVSLSAIAQKDTVRTIMSKKFNPTTNLIKWPEEFNPEKTNFYVYNEIEINAKPEAIWNILIDALKWESWYKGAKNVSMTDSNHKFLQANSVIKWETMGQKFISPIQVYEPNKYLAWESRKKSITGYHAWVIAPTVNGCRLITAESQNGFLTFMQRVFLPNKLLKLHDTWIKLIKEKAENQN
ncbi:MAG: SRPBCC family protein [Cytophagales bacterium]